MTRTLFASLAAAVAAAGFSTAQQPAAVPAQPGAAQPAGGAPAAFRAKDILGTKVALQNNTQVGTVEDIVFSAGGDVEYLVVATQDGKLTSVPWAAATFNPVQKTAVVDIPAERWKTIPTYTAQTYPDFFTPTYRTQVYQAYGLTPGQFRRVERRIERRVP